MYMCMEAEMRTERIVVLVSPEEKGELKRRATSNAQSVGDYVRSTALLPESSLADFVSPEQRRALEEAAKRASAALKRGNEALDRAFAEIERTNAHFARSAERRALMGYAETELPGTAPRKRAVRTEGARAVKAQRKSARYKSKS